MGYETALKRAYSELKGIAKDKKYTVRFLTDEYSIDLAKKNILSLSCSIPAPVHISILILHYLRQGLMGLPKTEEDWITFQQLAGGQGYYPVFKKRVIDKIKRKYGQRPEALLDIIKRFKAKRVQLADIGVVVEIFDGVPILIELWHADEEFGPSADLLFDKSIKDIFCTEDVVVLSEILASSI